jgi:hypothetical protein
MRRFAAVLAFATLVTLGTEARAQEAGDHPVEQELRGMVIDGDAATADRADIADFLEREDVQEAAAERGIDLERVKDGVRTLDAGEAASLAQRVQDVEERLAGGDTFVITSTTIIIILLVLILISVA